MRALTRFLSSASGLPWDIAPGSTDPTAGFCLLSAPAGTQRRSKVIHPVTILSTLPSAGVGALLALLISGSDLGIVGIIGIILLIGIVKKNAIMMIDFALDAERNEGKPPREAIYQACLLRFRPILMTTMAALLAAIPLALGSGDGAELRRPLGISIVGGLIVSQMLTLYTTPVVYLYLDRFSIWTGRLRQRRFPRASPAAAAGD